MIELRKVHKKFGTFVAVKELSLSISEGEFVALLGPSGCGKTTLLRIIAGLEFPDSGSIFLGQTDVSGHTARQREVGFVFQHYALFRHMSVFENVAFGLKVKPRASRLSGPAIRQKVHELLALVQLDWAAGRYPHQLSGGQRQRIALARALAVEPKVILLDEPFGSLDAKVRKELRRWLRRLHDNMGLTSVFVTHDQEEAMEIADRIVVMKEGGIEQIGTPEEIYNNPESAFVFHFLGNANTFEGLAESGKFRFGDVELPLEAEGPRESRSSLLCVRPHDVYIRSNPVPNGIPGTIVKVHFLGPTARIEVSLPNSQTIDAEINFTTYKLLKLKTGQQVYLEPRNTKMFPLQV